MKIFSELFRVLQRTGRSLLKEYMTFDEALTEALLERENQIWESTKHNYAKPELTFEEYMKQFESKINEGEGE